MYKKLIVAAFLSLSPFAYGCFSDNDCSNGNICQKSGNLMGMCIVPSQPSYFQGQSVTTKPPTTTTYAPPALAPSNSGSSQSNSNQAHLPQIPPAINNPSISGPCTDTVNCQPGFVCSKQSYGLYGVCVRVVG